MNRSKKITVMLGVLLIVCAVTFGVSRYEEHKEKIINSDEIVLELPSEEVTSLSWEYEGQSLAFHKDEGWLYDEDENFPVSEDKIRELLEPFTSFGVSFMIEEVEDYGQYGLDEPLCTIRLGTEEQTYEIALGDFSTMDEERYVSIGDGNVYLVENDPMELYELELKDMIQNDEVPEFDTVTELAFTGSENYTVRYREENTVTYNEEDVYFVEQDQDTLPLDTSKVDNYVDAVSGLNLSDYVSYNATEEEIAAYGLDDPELTVTLVYTTETQEGETEDTESDAGQDHSFVLHVSRSAEARETERLEEEESAADNEEAESMPDAGQESGTAGAADDSMEEDIDEADEDEEEEPAYARVGDSQIIYQISGTDYETLMAASYDDLRHREVIWAHFSDISRLDIDLEGETYTLTTQEEDEEKTWYYQEEELDISSLRSALVSMMASEFTEEEPEGREEISLTVYLDNENQPQVTIQLYRYDGTDCLAVVDGEPVSFVSRSYVVDLAEAVNAIVLKAD